MSDFKKIPRVAGCPTPLGVTGGNIIDQCYAHTLSLPEYAGAALA